MHLTTSHTLMSFAPLGRLILWLDHSFQLDWRWCCLSAAALIHRLALLIFTIIFFWNLSTNVHQTHCVRVTPTKCICIQILEGLLFYCWLIDINECEEGVSGCSQLCNNTVGGYFCSCTKGYSLLEDGSNCVGKCSCTPYCTNHQWTTICCKKSEVVNALAIFTWLTCEYVTAILQTTLLLIIAILQTVLLQACMSSGGLQLTGCFIFSFQTLLLLLLLYLLE